MNTSRPRIAVVGGGVAGLTAAWLLQRVAEVDLYDRNRYAGGHTCTHTIADGPDAGTAVDMGFIVMNHRNYPVLTRLFEVLGVALGDSDMSFSYHSTASGYAYSGSGVNGLFANRFNLFRPRHWRMIRDILRFNREATAELESGGIRSESLGDYLAARPYSQAFADHYLLAMGAAIWSAPKHDMLGFPAEPFIRFFHNHGLLTLQDRPQWKYVQNGSHSYVKQMLDTFDGRVHLGTAVDTVQRNPEGATVTPHGGAPAVYDKVVIAAHADEALAMLADPSPEETRLLGPWCYTDNRAILHTSTVGVPRIRRAWASWNFAHTPGRGEQPSVSVTYHMNRLQQIDSATDYLVSLNPAQDPPAAQTLETRTFTHPMYTFESVATQEALPQLNGKQNTYFCGSYFGYGFHEDAARSATEVAAALGAPL